MSAFDLIAEHCGGGDYVWKCIAGGEGMGSIHRVVFLKRREVITCSNTHGFLGTPEQFVNEFKPVKAT